MQVYGKTSEMALSVLLFAICISSTAADREMAVANITRFASGDLFSLVGTDCGPTRCMEASHGTALAAMGASSDACVCQCRRETPAFREDLRICVNHIEECLMASFGRGTTKPMIPFVFLPLKGQIIYPAKEINFSDVDDAICAVTSAQYLSGSGWVTLRDLLDNDVPFSLYRDEGSTFLQWRGSASLHARLEGRLVAVHVLCSAMTPTRLSASCAAFRVAGASHNALLDVRSIPFHGGEIADSNQSQGLTVLEALAIGVCVLMLIFIYAAGIIFYIHYKQRQKKKDKDAESNTVSTDNGTLGSRIDLENVMLKTNPLLKMDNFTTDFGHDAGFSDASEHTEDTVDSSVRKSNRKLNHSVISAMVHTRRSKKPSRPTIRMTSSPEKINERLQRRSASPDIERAPHSELAIVDCSMENGTSERESSPPSIGEQVVRRKLYFNPVFFETELLKNPPPAAVEFLEKIREVMSIAKDKMTTKRFVPSLSDIPEEASYHSINLGWDIPCARRGRRFSAISLKRENSRRAIQCGGCPGCDSGEPLQKPALVRSNSCKSCVSEDYKQRIVRKWLDEVPTPPPTPAMPMPMPIHSIAKMNGTPRVISPKPSDDERVSSPDLPKIHKNSQKTKETVTKENAEEVSEREVSDGTSQEESSKEPRRREVPSKKEKRFVKPPKIVKEIIKSTKDTKSKEEISKRPMSPLTKPNKPEIIGLTKSQISGPIIHTPPQCDSPVQEKPIPSNHATRRIRKKLPPPPPPPSINPPIPKVLEKMESKHSHNESLSNPEDASIPNEVKTKMQAVIRELNVSKCSETDLKHESKPETNDVIPPKIIIPVTAAPDTHYFSDDNLLADLRRKPAFVQREAFVDFDSMERMMLKRRRFSLACGPELIQKSDSDMTTSKETLTRSWRDVRKAVERYHCAPPRDSSVSESRKSSISEIFIENNEPIYDNIAKPGPLTIQVTGSPIENRRNIRDEFDPDTLDRKPRRDSKKRVEKILLKSGGSFKNKPVPFENGYKSTAETAFTRKIGSLRQIYEAKAKEEQMRLPYYERRGSLPYVGDDLSAIVKSAKTSEIIRQLEAQKEPKPPLPPKFRRGPESTTKFSNSVRESPGEKRRTQEERERYSQYLKAENIVARRSGRRSNRTRSRRTDLRRIYRTEDSGYLSTDSNESKRRANYLMQLRPKCSVLEQTSLPPAPTIIRTPILPHMESDTDEMESVCDGRSESGGESIETDSVFFGNFDESKQMLAELGVTSYEFKNALRPHEQIDSGFMGETNIILSGDSDSEHRSVISIITGRDGRASASSIKKFDEAPYSQSVDC